MTASTASGVALTTHKGASSETAGGDGAWGWSHEAMSTSVGK